MSQYKSFRFKKYDFDAPNKTLTLTYGFDEAVEFTETFHFDFPFSDYNDAVLQRACQGLFFMAGVSYFKAYLPSQITIQKSALTPASAQFYSKTYQKGLGEFFYMNKLDPHTPITFPAINEELSAVQHTGSGLLIGLGGGKDSLVSIELLRAQPKVATWSVGHRPQLTPLVERVGLPHFWVERQWDRSLLEHNAKGAMNGHIPISAILAAVGTVVAVLTGYHDVVMSNEHSANEPTLTYKDVAINHQYSKSLEFEQDYQAELERQYGETLCYYSFLRPFSEVRIAELFAKSGFQKYKDVFSSCNRAFVHSSQSMSWCGECPKCAFIFLALTPFVPRTKLEALFGGKNLLLEPALAATYKQLLGIAGDKPLDCVGEIKESRAAMRLAQETYPELQKYVFDLPPGYDFRQLADHAMPPELFAVLQKLSK